MRNAFGGNFHATLSQQCQTGAGNQGGRWPGVKVGSAAKQIVGHSMAADNSHATCYIALAQVGIFTHLYLIKSFFLIRMIVSLKWER